MRSGMAAGHHRPHGTTRRQERSEWIASPTRAAGTALPAKRTPRTATSAKKEGATGGTLRFPRYYRFRSRRSVAV